MATLLFVKVSHKRTDCAIIGNQRAKTLQEAEASNSLKLYLRYYMLGRLQEQQIAMELVQTMSASLTSFSSPCRPTSNEVPPDTQWQLTDKPSWCVKNTLKKSRTMTRLASTVSLHQRVHIIAV